VSYTIVRRVFIVALGVAASALTEDLWPAVIAVVFAISLEEPL
jgi:hypothetical protein